MKAYEAEHKNYFLDIRAGSFNGENKKNTGHRGNDSYLTTLKFNFFKPK